MTRKQIKILALKSYTRGNLDYKKIKRIIKFFKRSELKKFISYLKVIEAQKKLVIVVPKELKEREKLNDMLLRLYPNKKIEYLEDPSLILGVRVINSDQIFEYNLRNTFESLKTYLEESYD